MIDEICIQCHKYPVFIRKWSLCRTCYHKEYKKRKFPKQVKRIALKLSNKQNYVKSYQSIKKYQHLAELQFIKNFFTHQNWIPQPAVFMLDGVKYTPDFYDNERNMFIEVSGTRQAYNYNKGKYDLFRELFPKLNFEIRKASGELLNEDNWEKNWEQACYP